MMGATRSTFDPTALGDEGRQRFAHVATSLRQPLLLEVDDASGITRRIYLKPNLEFSSSADGRAVTVIGVLRRCLLIAAQDWVYPINQAFLCRGCYVCNG